VIAGLAKDSVSRRFPEFLPDRPDGCKWRSAVGQLQGRMALYKIPPNTGKVRVATYHGGVFAVWNGKQGKHEFKILVRSKKKAEEVAQIINSKQHDGSIEVLS